MSTIQPKPFYCAVDFAFQRIGGKYKGRILWALRNESLRFGELSRHIEGVTTKMLTQALKELETDRLITRRVVMKKPLHVEYSLTTSAQELIPFIDHMRIWGEHQIEKLQ
ncbi:MAG TPA: helix-turn-helix domain-containing protein [Cyclobacteriaceae bacterium]|jgi:DNA-binding HxlR family transcriptional regulator|nr:helix-turn-helix domain-containing protein [Cyclobacteriaceae bacterium]